MNNGAITAPVRSLAINNGPVSSPVKDVCAETANTAFPFADVHIAHIMSRRMRVNLNFGVENGGMSGEDREKRTESKLYPCLSNLFTCLKSFWGGRKQILVYRYVL